VVLWAIDVVKDFVRHVVIKKIEMDSGLDYECTLVSK
jgi:hypothetical protein